MANPIKTATGWRMPIYVGGHREERSFSKKSDAVRWRDERTRELKELRSGLAGERKTMRDAFARYVREVSPEHKGARWEEVRLRALAEDPALPVTLPLSKLDAGHFAHWKTERLKQVKPGTVLREMNLISSVLGYARKDWSWMTGTPLADVRRPPQPPHRTRLITWSETRAMLRELGWSTTAQPVTKKQLTAAAFVIALRTGMRCGEVVGLTWERVHPLWVSLPETKNGTARDVPMSPKVLRVFKRLRGLDDQEVLPITTASVDTLFRKARKAAGLDGFVFHDSRHVAATRVGRTVGQPGRLSFPEFVTVFGWRDPKNAMIYVNPSAASLAGKL